VLAGLRPFRLAVAQQHQPMVLDAHVARFCLRVIAIAARAWRERCQDGAYGRAGDDAERSDEEERRR
jgi:hypothetical protein